jgi:hypothetical protein
VPAGKQGRRQQAEGAGHDPEGNRQAESVRHGEDQWVQHHEN